MPCFALDVWTLFWQKSTHVVSLGKPFQRILKAVINAYPNFQRQVPKVQELYQNDLKGIGLDHGWHWQRGSGFELDGQKLVFQQEDKCSKSEFLTVQLFREKVLLLRKCKSFKSKACPAFMNLLKTLFSIVTIIIHYCISRWKLDWRQCQGLIKLEKN